MKHKPFAHSVEFYDALYASKDYASEASYIHQLIQQHAPKALTLLDLGSGTGRHAIELERRGYQVAGVDLSPEMVAVARARAREAGSHCIFEVGDVREVRLARKFDVVISLFHVASYQVDDSDFSRFVSTIVAHLNPGGLVIFDFWCAAGVLSEPPQAKVRRVSLRGGEVVRLTEPVHNVADSIVDVNFEYLYTETGSEKLLRAKEL
ncbi:class I SAM-dependent methyltransferase, partial [bacterium]|nr:class I SAM-dependent methyltransferase [bacterium]